jgi:hypothetical protein
MALNEEDYAFADITNSSALLTTEDPNAWQSDFEERLLIDYRKSANLVRAQNGPLTCSRSLRLLQRISPVRVWIRLVLYHFQLERPVGISCRP